MSKAGLPYSISGERFEELQNTLDQLRAQLGLDPLDRTALLASCEVLERWAWAAQLKQGSLLAERTRLLIEDLSIRLGRKVVWRPQGFSIDVEAPVFDLAATMLLHAARNAVSHGIEPADIRLTQGKPPEGAVHSWMEVRCGELHVGIEDDGKGPDFSAIRAKAVASGRVEESQCAGMSEFDWLELLFEPGFSTQDEPDLISGRGIGLDLVRSEAQALGGKVVASRAPEGGFRLHLTLPLRVLATEVRVGIVGPFRLAFPAPTLVRVSGKLSDADAESLEHWKNWLGLPQSLELEAWKVIDIDSPFPVAPRVIGFSRVEEEGFAGFRRLDPVWKNTGPHWIRQWIEANPQSAAFAASAPELRLWVDPGELSAAFPR